MELDALKKLPLFEGIDAEGLAKLYACMAPTLQVYPKNAVVYTKGDEITSLCVILTGAVRIIRTDFAGNTNITASLAAPDFFGEAFVFANGVSTVTVRASEPSAILFIDRRFVGACASACAAHTRLLLNLLRLTSAKTERLDETLYILQKRTTREKLLAYLYRQAEAEGSNRFRIPLNRAALAAYLCVDRSAMSRELCAMRDEGMLEFYKNSFILNEQ